MSLENPTMATEDTNEEETPPIIVPESSGGGPRTKEHQERMEALRQPKFSEDKWKDVLFSVTLSILFAILVFYIFYWRGLYILELWEVDFWPRFSMLVTYIPMAIAWILTFGSEALAFVVGFSAPIIHPLASVIFWAPLFYIVARFTANKFYYGKSRTYRHLPAFIFILLLTSPLFSLIFQQEIAGDIPISTNAYERCLSGKAKSPAGRVREPRICFDILIKSEFGNSIDYVRMENRSSDDLINICLSLSDTKNVSFPNDSIYDESKFLPSDISHQEYCIYAIEEKLEFPYSNSTSSNIRVTEDDFAVDFYRTHIGEIPLIEQYDTNLNGMPGKMLVIDGMSIKESPEIKAKLCDVYGNKTNSKIATERCLRMFDHNELVDNPPSKMLPKLPSLE